MPDVTKVVLTKFEADPSQFNQASRAMGNSIDQVNNKLDTTKRKQKEVADGAGTSGKAFTSSLGSMADGLGKLIPGFDQVSGAFKKAEGAAKSFGTGAKSALISTGIGVLIIAVQELYEAWNKFDTARTEAAKKASEKAAADEIERINDLYGSRVAILQQEADLLKASGADKEKIYQAELAALAAQQKALGFNQTLTEKQYAKESDAIHNRTQLLIASHKTEVAQEAQKRKEIESTAAAKKKAEADKLDSTAVLAGQQKVDLLKAEKAGLDAIYQAELSLLQIRLGEGGTAAENLALQRQIELLTAKYNTEQASAVAKQEEADKDFERQKLKEKWAADDKALAEAVAESLKAKAKDKEETEKQMAEAEIAGREAVQGAVQQLAQQSKTAAIALALRDTYNSVMAVMKDPSIPFTVLRLALAGFVGAMGLKNVKKIAASKFEQGGFIPSDGGMIRGRRHYQGGVKFRIGGYAAEAEGGEYIVNRKATRRFLPQLEAINSTGKYADGGLVTAQAEFSRFAEASRTAAASQQQVLVLEDFRRANDRLNIVESLARA